MYVFRVENKNWKLHTCGRVEGKMMKQAGPQE